jgi:16S rRNA (adenine1518-N6/adenine1519-N6)-dimethyltransferase
VRAGAHSRGSHGLTPDPSLADAIAALPPLREEVAAAQLSAQKGLGQNFLFDLNLLDRIVRSIPLKPDDIVYEVGPGPGGLTRALLKAGARVVAVERDRRALPILERLAAAVPGRLTVIHGDALDCDAAALAGRGAHVAANLPYNIATPLLIGWLSDPQWPSWWQSATLMFQREVADRIVAAPGTAAFGRVSVLAQWRTNARIIAALPARAFTPAPKVDSAVVQLLPRENAPVLAPALLSMVTAAAFGQRRKMLRQAMKSLPLGLQALDRAGIDSSRRAETLSVDAFISLALAMAALKGPVHN